MQKGREVADDFGKKVGRAAESLSKQSENIAKSNIFQSVTQVFGLVFSYCYFLKVNGQSFSC